MATLLKRNMRLFGLPYQFIPEVDPRIPTVSKTVGRKYAENIVLDAPVISIIPGKPKYLPGAKNKQERQSTSAALLSAANDNFNPLRQIMSDNGETLRYYDFERSYTEYIKYVNILCRTCAAFLELNETIDGVSCQRYDYSKYKWNTESENGSTSIERTFNSFKSGVTAWKNALLSKVGSTVNINLSDTTVNTKPQSTELAFTTSVDESTDKWSQFFTNYNYVQFFIDPDISFSESMSNATTESKIKGMLDSGADMLKELSFIVDSAGGNSDEIKEFTADATDSLKEFTKGSGTISGIIDRVISLSGNIMSGENIVMPDIYQNSTYDKSYTFTVHLKTPYGSKFGYFMDICVPLMHLLALGLPRQGSANSYSSPFLIKAYCEGIFTCNMGMVESVQVSKGVNNAYSVDGLPTEVDVSVTIKDLYSDLSMSPQSAPLLFINNSSLIEYLATTCGLSLITPNIEVRLNMIINAVTNAFLDIDDTIMAGVTEAIDSAIMDFLGLSF